MRPATEPATRRQTGTISQVSVPIRGRWERFRSLHVSLSTCQDRRSTVVGVTPSFAPSTIYRRPATRCPGRLWAVGVIVTEASRTRDADAAPLGGRLGYHVGSERARFASPPRPRRLVRVSRLARCRAGRCAGHHAPPNPLLDDLRGFAALQPGPERAAQQSRGITRQSCARHGRDRGNAPRRGPAFLHDPGGQALRLEGRSLRRANSSQCPCRSRN